MLWVEDDDSWFDTTSELFKENIDDYGFTPVIERKKSLEEVIEEISLNSLKKYDILLIDFNLKNSTGDSIIDFLRDKDIYTDIIFYSSDKNLILDSIREHQFEGVYHSDRKELEDKFEKVFKTTIKKIEEINSMRGLVVGETSELDALIEDNLMKYLEEPYISKFDVNKYINEKIFVKQESKLKYLKEEYESKGIHSLLLHIDAIRKWELLRGILKKNKDYNVFINEFLIINAEYQVEVIEIRNKFAHAKVIISEDGKELLKAQIGENHFEFNEETFKNIRENLLKHRGTLNGLKDI